MREILFRGKRIDNGEWVDGNTLMLQADPPEILWKENGKVAWAEVDPSTAGQYTGLKDKNGKRIFEGDIVVHRSTFRFYEIAEKGVVFWSEERCGWRRTSNGELHNGAVDTYRMSRSCDYEVIGNIHDNPELIGGKE